MQIDIGVTIIDVTRVSGMVGGGATTPTNPFAPSALATPHQKEVSYYN